MKISEKFIKTVGVLFFQGSKVLLVEHKSDSDHLPGRYGIPAGRKLIGESDKETALREFTEETGLISEYEDLIKLPMTYQAKIPRKNGEENFTLTVFLCKNAHGKLRETRETIPRWIEIQQVNKLQLLPNMEKVSSDGLEFISKQKNFQ